MGFRRVAAVAALLGACGDASGPPDAPAARATSAIVAGRPSDDTENATVFVRTETATNPLRCSGLLVAPNLVLTARHCMLTRRSDGLMCSADGSPVDPTNVANSDLATSPPGNISVGFGAAHARFDIAKVAAIEASSELTLCTGDVAFVILERPLADIHVPLRRAAIRRDEVFRISGWGYTADGQTVLPETRSTLDAVAVLEVGPGLMPAGTFMTLGATMCLGDSGAVALFDGAAGGVYSRITGSCGSTQTSNYFSSIAGQTALIERAYRRAGQVPWFAGDPPPWAATPACDAGCAEATPPTKGETGCATSPRGACGAGWREALIVGALAIARRRARGRSIGNPLG